MERFFKGIRKITVLVRVERDSVPVPVPVPMSVSRQQRDALSADSRAAVAYSLNRLTAPARLLPLLRLPISK